MDLSTNYLGLQLPHPFLAGAGPLADSLDSAKRLEDAGAAAIVMRSLFEEQINSEAIATLNFTETHADSSAEAMSYFATPEEFVIGPDEYLEHLRRIKTAVKIPVIASLNGYTAGGWLDSARVLEEAGADALELNLYYIATDAEESAVAIEQNAMDIVKQIGRALTIPLAVKLSPFYTSLAHFAGNLEAAGASGLVLFNRFFETDINLEQLEIQSHLHLSDSRELLLRLRWLAILSGSLRTATLAVTGGVHTAQDAVKAIMCGASAVQMVSALLRHGPEYLGKVRREMAGWMLEREYESLEQMRGSMNIHRSPNPKALSRANYMRQLQTWVGE